MKNFLAITNKGREISVKARTENGAWVKANGLAGSEWIVEILYSA